MRPFVQDAYAALNYRAELGDGISQPPMGAPSWVPVDDQRRLTAYRILASYADNTVRYWLPDNLWQRGVRPDGNMDPSPAEKYREYGDAGLLVEQGRSLLLGDTQTVVMPDAEPLPEDATAEEHAAQQRAAGFLDWLQRWADDEALTLRLIEGETDAVSLGDGVYVLGWDSDAGRPVLEVYDPGFYFPVLTGNASQRRYPDLLHLAWEEEEQATGRTVLHRITYSRERLADGATRRYPWQERDEPASRWTVYWTHATWDLGQVAVGGSVYDLSDRAASYVSDGQGEINRRDLGIDFIPVVHEPNDAAGKRHFGRSLLIRVAQLLDDLAFTDTDLQASSEQAAAAWVTKGAPIAAGVTGPGRTLNLPVDGSAELVDTSKILTAQLSYDAHLLDRLSVNTRLAAALLGRVKPNEVPSGYALELGFAATRSLVREMRAVRADKLPLIPKFAMRLAQVAGVLPAGPTPRAEILLGSFLPADRAAAVQYVSSLLPVHGISVHTAVRTLVAAGFPIDDAEDEVARIRAEWPQAAVEIVDATGDEAAAADWLGLSPTAAPGLPPVVLPPAPGGGP